MFFNDTATTEIYTLALHDALPIFQIVTEWAWHALFVRQLFRRPTPEELETFEPDWTVISVPGFETDPERDGTNSETDRKSTRLNSSHANISYAVFCLKKKQNKK